MTWILVLTLCWQSERSGYACHAVRVAEYQTVGACQADKLAIERRGLRAGSVYLCIMPATPE